ncbi:MAG TPA: hypothetical protein VG604_01105 [Candidatus Saccharimonadales bacterium]|nr:hypothetical protein [Candidatus Saccharimonadales bacterium]
MKTSMHETAIPGHRHMGRPVRRFLSGLLVSQATNETGTREFRLARGRLLDGIDVAFMLHDRDSYLPERSPHSETDEKGYRKLTLAGEPRHDIPTIIFGQHPEPAEAGLTDKIAEYIVQGVCPNGYMNYSFTVLGNGGIKWYGAPNVTKRPDDAILRSCDVLQTRPLLEAAVQVESLNAVALD